MYSIPILQLITFTQDQLPITKMSNRVAESRRKVLELRFVFAKIIEFSARIIEWQRQIHTASGIAKVNQVLIKSLI